MEWAKKLFDQVRQIGGADFSEVHISSSRHSAPHCSWDPQLTFGHSGSYQFALPRGLDESDSRMVPGAALLRSPSG